METAKKSNDNYVRYIDFVADVAANCQIKTEVSIADLAAIYARLIQAARRLEVEMTKAADLELQEVKPAITMAVTSAALDLAARVTRHFYVEQDNNAADGAGLEEE